MDGVDLPWELERTGIKETFVGDINRFMNRLLGMSVAAQQVMCEKTVEVFEDLVCQHLRENKIDPQTKGGPSE